MKEYIDFELQLRQLEGGSRYTVEVKSAPIDGDYLEEVELPDASDLDEELRAYENARGAQATRRSLDYVETETEQQSFDLKSLGHKLHSLLLPGRILECYNSSIRYAKEQQKGLRVVLRIDKNSPALAAYPWECVHDGEVSFLTLTSSPVIRHVEVMAARPALNVSLPLRILGMVGYRKDLNVEQEQRRLQNVIDAIRPKGSVEIEWIEGTEFALQQALLRKQWHVFHFIGHGDFDGQAKICLLKEGTQEPDELSAENLGTLLASHPSLQLAVLNSCEGGRVSKDEYFSSIGAVVGQHEVPAVISMQHAISDSAAIEFSRMLYTCLLELRTGIEDAVTEARKRIQKSEEWSTPVLHLRARGGRLFSLEKERLVSRGATVPEPERASSADADVAAANGPEAQSSRATPKPASSRTTRPTSGQRKTQLSGSDERLSRVAVRVRDAMEVAAPMLEFEVEAAEGAVEDEWADASVDIAPGQSLYNIFVESGESLLLLGDPGVGKSVIVNRLQHDLMKDFESETDPADQVPIRVSLRNWTKDEPMLDWMARNMGRTTKVPVKICKECIEAGLVLPLFEDLEDVDERLRAACVLAINAYQDEVGAGMLVTCNSREYLSLPADARLALNAAVTIKPYTWQQVLKFVERLGSEYSGLHAVLSDDPDLLGDARSYRDLIQMITAYKGLSPAEIGGSGNATMEERKAKLVGKFVDRKIEDRLAAIGDIRQ